MDAHLGDRQAGRDAAQAVGPQPGRLVRQSGHAAARMMARPASRPFNRTATRSSSPAPAPRRKARGRSSIGSTSRRCKSERLFQTDRPLVRDRDRRAVGRRLEDPDALRERAPIRRTSTCATSRPARGGRSRRTPIRRRSSRASRSSSSPTSATTACELSATIITPPGWTPAQGPLPTLLWAYPREFTDPTTAGQVTGSADRYTSHQRRVAPAVPHAGLRHHRRPDDADRRTG